MVRARIAPGLFAVVALHACGPGSARGDGASGLDVILSADSQTDARAACGRDAFDWGAGGPAMLPGTDCASCHHADRDGGDGGRAARHPFSLAGTVFRTRDCPEGVGAVSVTVRDRLGRTVTVTSEPLAGNFSANEPLEPPLHVIVSTPDGGVAEMAAAPHGSCNACHTRASRAGLVFAP